MDSGQGMEKGEHKGEALPFEGLILDRAVPTSLNV